MANTNANAPELGRDKLLRTFLHALRHDPWKYGLELDDEGWALVEDVLLAVRFSHYRWDSLEWHDVEAMIGIRGTDRLQIQDGRIRATYGHSVPLTMLPPAVIPPEILFHGTAMETFPEISRHGLQPIHRQFVHLTEDASYAGQISALRTDGIVLIVKAARAAAQGVTFRKANQKKRVFRHFSSNSNGRDRTFDLDSTSIATVRIRKGNNHA